MNEIKKQIVESVTVLQDYDQDNMKPYSDVFLYKMNGDHSAIIRSTQNLTFHLWKNPSMISHAHQNYFEIFIVTEGKIIHTVGNRERTLVAGDALLILPGEYHKFTQYEYMRSAHINLTCSLSCAKDIFKSCCNTEEPSFLKHFVHLSTRYFQIAEDFQDIILKSFDQYSQSVVIKSFFSIMLSLFYTPDSGSEAPAWLQSFINVIHNLCFDSSFKISDLYANAKYSRTKLSREFKEYTGQTIVSYINDLKLAHACNQLKSTDLTVLQIATTSGFETYVHFAREFKKKYNCTPKEYRKKSNS